MPTDPLDDVDDNERTDELPVLVETVVLGSTQHVAAGGEAIEDTAERTAKFQTDDSAAEIESLQTDLAARGAKIAALEEDITRLSARWNEIERHLTSRDTRIEELSRTLTELRRTLADRHVAEQRLSTELAQRTADVDRLSSENTALRAAAGAAEANLAALAAASRATAQLIDPTADALRQEIASLSAYIANRSDWWREVKSQVSASADRIASLQREMRDLAAAHREATALAARESARAAAIRGELVAATHIVEAQRREIASARSAGGQESPTAMATIPASTASAPAPDSQLVAPDPAPPSLASIDQALAAAAIVPTAAAADAPPAPAFEVLAALEAEIAHKRQQIAAQLVELREREQRLETGAATVERLRQDVTALRAELDQRRADVSRLERAVVDKDRALEARDLRIATLQDELNQRLGAIQKLNAMDVSLQGLSSKMSDRLRRAEPATESANVPTLVCLTGDAPKQLPLTKKTITIGRGHDCDIQILTHFVSREHARITTDRGAVFIEDLASTNGVFVNAVRIDRHELHHGDLLTIGETQFRFLESVAH